MSEQPPEDDGLYQIGEGDGYHGAGGLEVMRAPAGRAVSRCPHCLDDGHVCEDHPEFPWEGIHGTVEGHAEHGGSGMPCPACCSPIPEDGTCSIAEAFTPDWMRGADLPAVALEPDTLPNRPLTADQVEPLIAKEIGLPVSVVRLHVGDELLLRAMFRLPEGITLEGASVTRTGERGGAVVLNLEVDMPDAPPDAAMVDVTYLRYTGRPDPVQITGFRWFREDGSEIEPLMVSGRERVE